MASLPPLFVPKKPIGLQSSTGTLSLDELGGEASEDLKKLSKDAHNVLGVNFTLYLSLSIVIHKFKFSSTRPVRGYFLNHIQFI